jgi:hypothetical protein
MSQPVKVPDKLYAALRRRAQEDQTTIQEALVVVIEEGRHIAHDFERRLMALSQDLVKIRTSQAELDKLVAGQRSSLQTLKSDITTLRQARAKDTEAHNSWVPTWNQVGELATRVEKLEKTAHQHFWQSEEE